MSDSKKQRPNKSSTFDFNFKPFADVDLEVVFNVQVKHPRDLTKLPQGTYNKRVVVDLRDLVETGNTVETEAV